MGPTVRMWPGANRRTLSTAEEQRTVMAAVGPVIPRLPQTKEVVIEIGDPVREGCSLAEAHRRRTEAAFPELETPSFLPRRPPGSVCPSGLIKVDVDCIEERTPGMGSWYQFRGYSLSLLISLEDGTIWDARGDQAT